MKPLYFAQTIASLRAKGIAMFSPLYRTLRLPTERRDNAPVTLTFISLIPFARNGVVGMSAFFQALTEKGVFEPSFLATFFIGVFPTTGR
jgi:hypothetical protein